MGSQGQRAVVPAGAARKPEALAPPSASAWQAGLPMTGPHQVLQHLLRSGAIQAKLTVSQPGDPLEEEADRVAEQVMRMPAAPPPATASTARTTDQPIQPSPRITPDLESRIHVLHGGGAPLPASERRFFEPRFGSDFGNVRVHTDGEAADLARRVEARAFTVGRSVVFGAGQYAPETAAGRALLAHELTHVVQQGNAAPAGSPAMQVQRQAAAAPNSSNLPVPAWDQLPEPAKTDLQSRGFHEDWFKSKPDDVRLSVLNQYVKLKALGLWQFVESDDGSNSASLTFTCTDIPMLKRALRARDDFTGPKAKSASWDSREYRSVGALHLKHFEDDPPGRVQAHIDAVGKYPSKPLLVGLAALTAGLGIGVHAAIHGIEFHSYKDPYRIRDILVSQGFDQTVLRGRAPK